MGRLPARGVAWREHLRLLALPLASTLLVHIRALDGFFAQDDITFLARAAGLEPANWWFRPLSVAALRLEHALFGLEPFGYLAVNLALHLANTAWVYAIGTRLLSSGSAAAASAALFGASSIAFTPLHWASGNGELLSAGLTLTSTWFFLDARDRGRSAGLWISAALVPAAALAKETAAGWIAAALVIERGSGLHRFRAGALLPGALATAAFLAWILAGGQVERFRGSEAYARTFSPLFLATNLSTYVRWCVSITDPIRDVVAAADPRSLPVGLAVALAVLWWVLREPPGERGRAGVGVAWFVAFLALVLPLAHHTYLYYLYLPWAGACWLAAAAGRALSARIPRRAAAPAALTVLAAFVALEARNVALRETVTRDALPADRTVRDAVLLSHALPALRHAALPPGTRVAFVSPVSRPRFDLMTGAPTRPEDLARRESYWPLEGAMRGGETLRLFLPEVVYLGFATTIPPGWEDAECFHFEQRGWLESWGRGQTALMHQAKVQMAARRWAEAESTFHRVRALGDTLPQALLGQITARVESGRTREARPIAEDFLRRWPDDSLAGSVRAALATER